MNIDDLVFYIPFFIIKVIMRRKINMIMKGSEQRSTVSHDMLYSHEKHRTVMRSAVQS